jgi:hypothetical protein
LLPKGGVTNLILGWVNILGPNVFVPWDTHKRHLNYDRDVIDLIRNHPAVRELFENWSEAYKHISGIEVKKTIEVPYKLAVDKAGTLTLAHTDTVTVDATKKRGQRLPATVFKPVVKTPKKAKRDTGVALNMSLTNDESRRLGAVFKVSGALDTAQFKKALSDRAKEHLLGLIKGRSKRS